MYCFNPTSDMFETADFIVIQIELAGVNKEDINVEAFGGSLEVSGIKRRNGFTEKDNFHRMERLFGFFKRVFDLPKAVDRNSINASFNEVLLEIIVPKNNKNNCFRLTSIEIIDE